MGQHGPMVPCAEQQRPLAMSISHEDWTTYSRGDEKDSDFSKKQFGKGMGRKGW